VLWFCFILFDFDYYFFLFGVFCCLTLYKLCCVFVLLCLIFFLFLFLFCLLKETLRVN